MKKIYAAAIVLSLLVSALTGCGSSQPEPAPVPPADTGQTSAEEAPAEEPPAEEAPAEEVQAPVAETEEPVKLTYWLPLNTAVTKYLANMDENYAYAEYQKRTGVDIEFIHPAAGQEKEQFNLIVASNSLPDILSYPQAYPGGEFQGMRDGLFVDITDKLPALAPDYYKLLEQDSEFFREMSDNDGRIVSFSAYKPLGDPPARRMLLREDLLSELGIEIPKTRADYESMFDKMLAVGITPYLPTKLIYGVEPQFTDMFGIFAESTDASGLKFSKDENGVIQLGHIQPEFKEYLTMMNGWYNKGYISKDFTTIDQQQANTLFDTRAVGLITAPIVVAYNRAQTQGFTVTSAPYPRLNEGDQLHYGFSDAELWPRVDRMETTAVITKDCEFVDEAIRFMNYAYTTEGADLLNWGVEGVNWEMQEGKRVYNDTMLNNELFGTEEASYIYKLHLAPKLAYLDVECHANLLKSPDSLEARFKWADDPNVDSDSQLPPFQLSADAQSRRAEIMIDVTTYCNEMVLQFIIGAESLDNFDSYVETVKSMGVEEAIQLTQEAYDTYLSKTLN